MKFGATAMCTTRLLVLTLVLCVFANTEHFQTPKSLSLNSFVASRVVPGDNETVFSFTINPAEALYDNVQIQFVRTSIFADLNAFSAVCIHETVFVTLAVQNHLRFSADTKRPFGKDSSVKPQLFVCPHSQKRYLLRPSGQHIRI